MDLQAIITGLGALMVLAGVGGVAWLAASELRLRALRSARLQTAGGTQGGATRGQKSSISGGIGAGMLSGFKRLGQQSAVKDPAKLSVLRSRLMQAGFYNREAPVIYLGVRAVALVIAIRSGVWFRRT